LGSFDLTQDYNMNLNKNKSIKKIVTFAFIDAQNLNLGVKSQGWKLDWSKFRQYLRNKYNVTDAYLFIGYKSGNETLYTNLQKMGFFVVLKPTLELPDGTVKGNVDAELVLHAMIHIKEYDKAIIVTGDGDFHCLVEYLAKENKLLHLLVPNKHYSSLLRKFNNFIVRIDLLKDSLIQKKTEISVRSKP